MQTFIFSSIKAFTQLCNRFLISLNKDARLGELASGVCILHDILVSKPCWEAAVKPSKNKASVSHKANTTFWQFGFLFFFKEFSRGVAYFVDFGYLKPGVSKCHQCSSELHLSHESSSSLPASWEASVSAEWAAAPRRLLPVSCNSCFPVSRIDAAVRWRHGGIGRHRAAVGRHSPS